MNIYQYIKENGEYTFEEKKINEVDFIIFSFLSYADFTKVFESNEKYTLQEVGIIHKEKLPRKDNNVIAVKEGNKLLRAMMNTKRYKDCLIYNHMYISNETIQFGVISIEYQKNKVFVSFEGTDQSFSGWKENFILSYNNVTESHKHAIKYLNRYYTWNTKELIIGGHSKGGNLALVGSMYCNPIVRLRIKKIYGADSPGVLETEYHSKKYQRIKKKYIHIIPENSIVGILLYHSNNKVIKVTNKTILSHNIIYWVIKENHFEKATLNPLSKELNKEILKWLKQCNKEDKEEFVNNFDNILKKANVTSILELKTKKRNIIKILYDTREMSETSRKIIIDIINIIIRCFKDTKKEELKNTINNFYTIINKGIK